MQCASQFKQSKHVLRALEAQRSHTNRRFFIDLAANHPEHLSNTCALEQLGWQGVCIDAADQSRVLFEKSGRNCRFVRAAVAEDGFKAVIFRDIVPTSRTPPRLNWTFGLSSIVSSTLSPTCWGMPRRCISVNKFSDASINLIHTTMITQSLAFILAKVKAPRVIDYLSIDVEGNEDVVLASKGLRMYKFRTVTIERPSAYARKRLVEMNLRFKTRLGEDELWVHNHTKYV